MIRDLENIKEPFARDTFPKDSMVMLQWKHLRILLSIDNGMWHISVSGEDRIPDYYEMKELRYKLIPDDVTMAMIFPPSTEFVNVHEFCLHLYEID